MKNKNRNYPLYEIPPIRDLREMVILKQNLCPGKAAISYTDKSGKKTEKTFGDVFHDMNDLGNWMFAQNIRNQHIALIGENSYLWLIAFLAIVNGGNVAVPIDKELPGEETARLLQNADVTMIFCSDSCKRALSGRKTESEWKPGFEEDSRLVSFSELEQFCQSAAGREEDYRNYRIDVDKCCCIFFTSGTSGAAKGVCLSQRNLASELSQACRMVTLCGSAVVFLPFHHTFGLVEGVLSVFHYGYENYLNQSLRTVRKTLTEQKPYNLFLVPLYVETFHRQVWDVAAKQGRDKTLRSLMRISDRLLKAGIDLRGKLFASVREAFGGNLRYIICGGAAIDPFYIREFRSWGIEILSGYGTTECSPCVAVNRNLYHKDGTVGLMLPQVEAKTAPDGEILIRGDIVMLGYYKDLQATAEAIQGGWYYTGDIGQLDAEGFLTLTGRKKNLIILSNGENVSPEELEVSLTLDEGVREALVYEHEGRIVAELYPEEGYMGDREHFELLRQRVNQGQPVYKRIARVVLREKEFAKNSSMKIIRYQR